MNYLAHLYLAQPTADSHFGNLLGDFGGKKHIANLPVSVQRGLANHYLVDKFTDSHPLVINAKQYFSAKRRRFASIAIDVVFDHFLIKHWQQFQHQPLTGFKQNSYALLKARINAMPKRMQYVIGKLTQDDWFKGYETMQGVGLALDNIAGRIRFTNSYSGAIEDIHLNYFELEAVFLEFFPQLIAHVKDHGLE